MSTLRVSNLQNEASANNQITLGTDGFAQINGVAMPTAGALSNRNLIINGAMQVAQRGTSSTSSDWQTVDRFYYNFGGGLAGTQSQQALSSGTPYDQGFRSFYRFAISTASTAAGAYCQLIQPIEAQNLANSGWQYASADSDVTVSFWVRSSVAQTFYGQLVSQDGTQQNYIFSFALSADTWTKVTKTVPGNSNVTINNDNGSGLELIIVPFFGTNLTDAGATVDSWQAYSASSRVPDMTSTWANTTNATFDVTGVQLEVGQVATPFEHRSYGDELARCQRYYYRSTAGSAYSPFAVGTVSATNSVSGLVAPLPVTMRATPTISWSNVRLLNGSTAVSASTSVPYNGASATVWGGDATATASSLTVGRAAVMQANNNSAAYIDASAEL